MKLRSERMDSFMSMDWFYFEATEGFSNSFFGYQFLGHWYLNNVSNAVMASCKSVVQIILTKSWVNGRFSSNQITMMCAQFKETLHVSFRLSSFPFLVIIFNVRFNTKATYLASVLLSIFRLTLYALSS